MKKQNIRQTALCALFTAIITACSWIAIPTPFGVNFTLQLFGVCITALILGAKSAIFSVLAYLIIGAVGLPVFSGFTSGVGVLFGVSGGFLWGFFAAAPLCAIAKKTSKKTLKIAFFILSVVVCHALGVIQYSAVTGNRLLIAFLSVSAPFLAKDMLLVFLANFVSKKIKL